MRLDAFLKASRLVRRRSVAKELCRDGAVRVNGRPARAGREVRPGDRLRVRLYRRVVTVEIERIPDGPVSREGAEGLYRIVDEERIEEP